MNIPWIELAIKEAKKSIYEDNMGRPVRVGAVVFNKKRFISSGHNYGERSLSRSHHPSWRKYAHSIHAEIDAIIRSRKNLKGASILVIRINKQGDFRFSKPCSHCEAYIRHVGIKHVYYSTSEEPFITELEF